MNISGIIINDDQIEEFLHRLTRKYAGWEIEDIFHALNNRDMEDFEAFVMGSDPRVVDLEHRIEELERQLVSSGDEEDNLIIIQEQERRLDALGAAHLIVDRDALHRLREDDE